MPKVEDGKPLQESAINSDRQDADNQSEQCDLLEAFCSNYPQSLEQSHFSRAVVLLAIEVFASLNVFIRKISTVCVIIRKKGGEVLDYRSLVAHGFFASFYTYEGRSI